MLHLDPSAHAGLVCLVVALREDPVLAEPPLVGVPALGDREVVGPRRQPRLGTRPQHAGFLGDRLGADTPGQPRQALAPFRQRPLLQVVVTITEQVEQEQRRGDLGGELVHA